MQSIINTRHPTLPVPSSCCKQTTTPQNRVKGWVCPLVMELLGHEGTGCSQGQTSVSPMVCSILCNFCGFSRMRNTTGKWPEVLCWWGGSPDTWRALFSMDHTNNKILNSRDCVSDSIPTAQCQVHRAIENLINEVCYARLRVDIKMGQIQYTPPTAMKWKPCVVLQEGRPGFRMLNF